MENASKALIMAGGILIEVLILTLGLYLFISFGQQSKEMHDRITDNQLTQYNAQYTVYSTRTNITIYEIISVANLAHENNETYSEYGEGYKVTVRLAPYFNLQNEDKSVYEELIKEYSQIEITGSSTQQDTNYFKTTFRCKNIDYYENTGRVKSITFEENR